VRIYKANIYFNIMRILVCVIALTACLCQYSDVTQSIWYNITKGFLAQTTTYYHLADSYQCIFGGIQSFVNLINNIKDLIGTSVDSVRIIALTISTLSDFKTEMELCPDLMLLYDVWKSKALNMTTAAYWQAYPSYIVKKLGFVYNDAYNLTQAVITPLKKDTYNNIGMYSAKVLFNAFDESLP
jgi:hypothetical protein